MFFMFSLLSSVGRATALNIIETCATATHYVVSAMIMKMRRPDDDDVAAGRAKKGFYE